MAVPVISHQGDSGSVPWQFSNVCGRIFVPEGALLEIKWAAVNATASGDNTIINGVANKKYRVLAISLVPDSVVTMSVKSGASTVLIQPIPFDKHSIYDVNRMPHGWWVETNPGDALVFNLNGAALVRGSLNYIEIPAGNIP